MKGVLITIILLSGSAFAQNFIDFPVLGDGIPTEPVKGPVHTVLMTRRKGGELFDKNVVVYDEKGRITESRSEGGKAINVYDGTGKVVSVNKFGPGGELYAIDRYKYDGKDRLIEISFVNAKGESAGWQKFNYQPNNKDVEVTWLYLPLPTNPQVPSSWRSILAYDEKERWAKRTEFRNGEWTAVFEYDKDGAFIKDIHDGWNHTYKYKYDAHGNWVERIRSYHQSGDPISDIPDDMHYYRKITYYRAAKAK